MCARAADLICVVSVAVRDRVVCVEDDAPPRVRPVREGVVRCIATEQQQVARFAWGVYSSHDVGLQRMLLALPGLHKPVMRAWDKTQAAVF